MHVFKNLKEALLEAQEVFIGQGWDDVVITVRPPMPRWHKLVNLTLRYKALTRIVVCRQRYEASELSWAIMRDTVFIDATFESMQVSMADDLNLERIEALPMFHEARLYSTFKEIAFAGSSISIIELAGLVKQVKIFSVKDVFGSVVARPADKTVPGCPHVFLIEVQDLAYSQSSQLGKRIFLAKRRTTQVVDHWANIIL